MNRMNKMMDGRVPVALEYTAKVTEKGKSPYMKNWKRMTALLLAVCLMVPSLVSCGSKKETVVVFSSMEDYRNEELRRQLKEKFPDIEVDVQQLSTGNNAAKIKAEGTKTEADIVLGLETASFLQILDNFAPLDGYKTDHFLDGVNGADKRMLIWEKYEGAFMVNTKVLAAKGLAEPKTYDDLLKPEYKGMIVMPNPKTSGTGYMFLNTWVNTMGKEGALAYVDKLQENIKQFTESGSGPIQMLVQGEVAVGLGMVFQAAQQITEGAPIKVIEPAGGCPYNTTAFGIIKGKETRESVQKIFTFLNEEFIVYDKQHFVGGKILKDQDIQIPNYPTGLTSADMSTVTDDALKKELVEAWKY